RTYRTIVQLIAATTTNTGLKVRAELDRNKYPKGVKVSDAQLSAVNLTRHTCHGDWNYTIAPRSRRIKGLGYLWTSPNRLRPYDFALTTSDPSSSVARGSWSQVACAGA